MKKVGMVSLGCPKNTVDSERVMGDLASSGFKLTQNDKDAEVIIVNTCGFIESAKKESVDTILEMARHKTEGNCKQLIITGCLAERYGQELKWVMQKTCLVIATFCNLIPTFSATLPPIPTYGRKPDDAEKKNDTYHRISDTF